MNDSQSSGDNTWAVFAHLAALIGYIFPFGNLIGPAVIYLMKKDEMEFVADQAKESLNFQISITIYALISMALIMVVIGVFLLFAVGIFNIVMIIIAAVKANDGERYRYPFCLRLIK